MPNHSIPTPPTKLMSQSVCHGTQASVDMERTVIEDTCVQNVEVKSPCPDVPSAVNHMKCKTFLNRPAWAANLQFHPDQNFANTLLDYIDNGVPIGYSGKPISYVYPNWKSCLTYSDAVKKTLVTDVALGRKSGPFKYPPCAQFVGSPMGAFQKKHSSKIRVIHDLSWPPGSSVNSGIPADICSVKYITVDTAVKHVKEKGRFCQMCKVDLQDAYKQIWVRPTDWKYLGSSWTNENGVTEYYIDHVLPFGLRSSANLFDLFAQGLEFCIQLAGTTNSCHYLDDIFSCGKAGTTECQDNLEKMLCVCNETGLKVNPAKVEGPSTILEFLGIIIDSELMELRMSQTRVDDIKKELQKWLSKKWGTKRELLSIIGKLVFLTRVIKSGNIFLRRLYNMSTKVKCLHHKVKLTAEATRDIIWWLLFLDQWNRKSVFYEELWETNDDIEVHTDASNLFYAAICGPEWISVKFTDTEIERSICWKELLAIVSACATWGKKWSGKRLTFHCDNESIVAMVSNGTSKCPFIMSLIRSLFFVSSNNDFVVRLCHVKGVYNKAADLLSRNQISEFHKMFPSANVKPCTPGSIPSELIWYQKYG